MESKKSFGKQMERILAGHGFYIVMVLCAAIIGVSIWSLFKTPVQPVPDEPEEKRDAGDHRDPRTAVFTEHFGIRGVDAVGQETQAHDGQIPVSLGKCQVRDAAAVVKKQTDERLAADPEEQHPQHAERSRKKDHQTEHIPFAVVFFPAGKLRAEKTRGGDRAEDAQVIDGDQRVRDGDACQRLGTEIAHRDVVHQTDGVGDNVLDHDRDRDAEHGPVEGFRADKLHDCNPNNNTLYYVTINRLH